MSKTTNDIDNASAKPIVNASGYFGIEKSDLVTLFDKCGRNECFDEDIKEIIKLGGTEGILKKVRTRFDVGLSESNFADIQMRTLYFGENRFIEEPMPHCCSYVWEGLEDLMIRILILAAIFQIIVGSIPQIRESENDWIEGVSIVFAIVIVVTVGSVTNYTKELKFRELNEQNNALVKITVKRDGQVKTIQEEEIMVGDIIKVELGMILPADGYLLEGNDIKIEEASLTGESDLIEKDTLEQVLKRIQSEIQENKGVEPKGKHLVGSPLCFSGTEVAEGIGWYVALRIGPYSEKGKIQEQVRSEQTKSKAKKEEKKDEKVPGPDGEANKEEEEKDEEEDEDDGKTPLEAKLEVLANDIGMFGTIAAAATLFALTIRLIVTVFERIEIMEKGVLYQESKWYDSTLLGEPQRKRDEMLGNSLIIEIIKILILCIAIIVVAIPEGLPLAVTLSLAFSIGKMMEDNNLVRKMNACETMGGANYICSDKTGTLTKNEMSIEKFFNGNEIKSFKALTNDKNQREDPLKYFTAQYYETLKLAITLNIDVEIDINEKIVKGSKTDYAFVHLLHNLNEKIFETRKQYDKSEEKFKFPFTSSRKKMSTIISNEIFETGHIIFQKGASEIVLAACTHYLDPNTSQHKHILINDEKKQQLKKTIKDFADCALRTIVLAFKNISKEQKNNWKEKKQDDPTINVIEASDFTLLGIFGIKDQLRDGVADAVDKCQKAGIKVVMVTGDNIDTANAIARDCHILTPEVEEIAKETGKVISYVGKDFYELIGGMCCDSCNLDLKFCTCPRSERQAEAIKKKKLEIDPNFTDEIKLRKERIVNMEKFKEIYEDIRVIARSRPEDKYTMVYGLRVLEQVVAVTGDGTNDAPALSKSDVGFAMGVSGTDIAKQAADIIILDDNFATIVQAVKWGRNIYENIRKFIQFQLTVNICACLLVFIASCIGKETPLSAIQMLWVNLIMDSLGSLALATEPPTDSLLLRKPYPKSEYIINSLMWKHLFSQAMIELAITLFLYLYAHKFVPETNPELIKLNQQILNCYGQIPGQINHLTQNVNFMIAGPVIFWPSNIERLPDALPNACGEFYKFKNLDTAHTYFIGIYGSAHLTVIFNTFVLYTLFNELNARVIDGSYNIFKDIHKNYLFIIIIFVELGLQGLLISVAGVGFKVSKFGLDGPQWGICFALGSITLIVSVILKPIPMERCFEAIYNWSQSMKENKGNAKKDVELEELNKTNAVKVTPNNVVKADRPNQQVADFKLEVEPVNISKKPSIKIEVHEHQHTDAKDGKKHSVKNILNLRKSSKQLTNKSLSGLRAVNPDKEMKD